MRYAVSADLVFHGVAEVRRVTLDKGYAVADVNGLLRSLINFKDRYKAKSLNWMALLTAWAEVTQSSLW